MQESFVDGIHFCLVFFFHNYLALILLLKIYIKRLELKITLSSLPPQELKRHEMKFTIYVKWEEGRAKIQKIE